MKKNITMMVSVVVFAIIASVAVFAVQEDAQGRHMDLMMARMEQMMDQCEKMMQGGMMTKPESMSMEEHSSHHPELRS